MAVDYANLISSQMHGDLAGFMNSWDNCLMAMSHPPHEYMSRALLDPQLRKRRALQPLFTNIDGSSPDSHKRKLE